LIQEAAQFFATGTIEHGDVCNTAGEVGAKAFVMLTILRFESVTYAIIQGGFQLVVFVAGDVGMLIDNDARDGAVERHGA